HSHSPFKIPEGRTLLALGRRGSNAQSHFPSPAPTQNSEWGRGGVHGIRSGEALAKLHLNVTFSLIFNKLVACGCDLW
ncbi:MAG: hypothetical protein LBL41_05450, partial [Bifidobacteriaceae bacterium]|nr:hypothetical protein [Bifidobacteriaceae bacterium]